MNDLELRPRDTVAIEVEPKQWTIVNIDELQEAFGDIEVILDLLTDSQMPIWWHEDNRFVSVARVIGWTITAIATTLGAPFWFDLLKRRLDKSKQSTASSSSSTNTAPS